MTTKKAYLVGIREVHVSTRRVFASSPEEARELAGEEGEEVSLEFSHTLEDDPFTTVEEDDNG